MSITNRMKHIGAAGFAVIMMGAAGLQTPVHAQAPPDLLSAKTFAVLAATTVTSTGATNVVGNLGVSPGDAVTGVSGGTVSDGAVYAGGPVPTQAEADLATAYGDIAGRPYIPANDLSNQDLGGMTLTPGVYHFNTSAHLGAPLTLDARGDHGAIFIFQIGTTLITGSNTAVILRGGARANNIFWQVGSSATIGAATNFKGNILAYTSVTLVSGANLIGRAMAENGAVTMDTNQVSRPNPYPDLVLQNPEAQQVAFWSTFAPNITGGAYLLYGTSSNTLPANCKVVASGDFDRDGTTDLVVENSSTGQIGFWFTTGNNLTSGAYATSFGTSIGVPAGWQIVGAGDFNNDGQPDLVLDNTSTGEIAIWTMNGTDVTSGAIVTSGGSPITLPAGWQIVGVADFNNDGHPDLVLDNTSTGQIAVWLANGATVTSGEYVTSGGSPISLPAGWQIAAVEDYNTDGMPDLVLQNLSTGELGFWYLQGANLTGSSYALSSGNPITLPTGWAVSCLH